MPEDINWNEYEEFSGKMVVLSDFLVMMWEKLGRPEDPFSESGKKLVQIVIDVWIRERTEEYLAWLEERKDYKDRELPIYKQVKYETNRTLISYPKFVLYILRKLFPNFKFAERRNALKMVKYFPIFLYANKV